MPLKTHLFAANGAGDEGHILGLVGRFQGDFVDVVDQRFAVDGARRLLVAHVVDALRRRQEPILRKKKQTNKTNMTGRSVSSLVPIFIVVFIKVESRSRTKHQRSSDCNENSIPS